MKNLIFISAFTFYSIGQQQLPVTLAGIQAGHTEVTED